MQRWYVNRTGHPEGPFDEAQVIETIRAGHVAPISQICPEGGAAWEPLMSHAPFAQAMPPSMSLPPSQPQDAAMGATAPSGTGSKKKLAMIGSTVVLLLMCCVGGVFVFRKGGFEKAAMAIANDMVRYGVKGEDVAGEWINDPPVSGGSNVYATDKAAIATALAPLGPEPTIAAVGVTFTLCGGAHSVRIMVVVVDGESKIAQITANRNDTCPTQRQDLQGRQIVSAHLATDERVKRLGARGVELWNTLRAPGCELERLTETDLTEVGIPVAMVPLLMRDVSEISATDACVLASIDSATTDPFVHIGGVDVVLVGQGRAGGLSARPSQSSVTPGEYTLTAIRGAILQ